MDEDRYKSRIMKKISLNDELTLDEYHHLANNFSEIPEEKRKFLLKRLEKNYINFLNNPKDKDDEFLILSNLISYFTLELSEENFSFNANVLVIIFNFLFRQAFDEKTDEKYQKLFESYFEMSLNFLGSENLIFISSTLSVINVLTSYSENSTKSILDIIPPNIFLDLINSSIEFMDKDQTYIKIIEDSTHILRNVFYPLKGKRIKRRAVENLFQYVHMLLQKDLILNNECFADILMCIRDVIAGNSKYCIKIEQYELIPFLNQCLESDIEKTRINSILIFDQLIKNKIGLDDIAMIPIIEMISPETNLSLHAIKVLAAFLQKCPNSPDVLFQLEDKLQLIPMLINIFQNGSLNFRLQALNVFYVLLSNASQDNKIVIFMRAYPQMSDLINALFEMSCNVNSPIIKLIFTFSQMIIQIANVHGYGEEIKAFFMESRNLVILEELANGDEEAGEIASQILFDLNNNDKSEK